MTSVVLCATPAVLLAAFAAAAIRTFRDNHDLGDL